jgi:hypothetical protein
MRLMLRQMSLILKGKGLWCSISKMIRDGKALLIIFCGFTKVMGKACCFNVQFTQQASGVLDKSKDDLMVGAFI